MQRESCFGSSMNLPKQEEWIAGEKSRVRLGMSHSCTSPQETQRGQRLWPDPCSKAPPAYRVIWGGFSIGVGTTRLAASGLE